VRATMRRGSMARYGAIDLAVAVLVLWHAVSAVVAVGTGAPRPAINSAWQWVATATMFWLIRQLVGDRREIRALVAIMIALAVAMSTFGFHQFFYSIPRDQARYAEDPDGALAEAHVFAPEGSRQRLLFEKRVNSSEPMATFALTNSLAGFLAPWLIVSLGIGAAAYALRMRDPRVWAPAVTCAAIILACLILTKSRAGILASAVGAVVLAAWTAAAGSRLSRRIVAVAVTGVVVVIVAAATVGALDREILTEAGKSLGYRLQYWQATAEMIRERPWFGCGPGQFQSYYTHYKLPEASETVADPHNFLLEIWATAGTPAALALLAVIGIVAWRVLKDSQRTSGAQSLGSASKLQPPDAGRASQQGISRRPRFSSTEHARHTSGAAPAFTDATHHVFAGGAGGFLLALLFGPLATVPLGLSACIGGLAVAAIVVASLYPWIVRGAMPAILLALAAVVLLVNLLAGGGINFAGVAGSLWLLAALCMATLEPWRKLTALPAVLLLAVTATLGGAFYLTVYQPAMACNLAMDRADIEPERAEFYLRAAAVADPFSTEPINRLAMVEWGGWQRHPSDAAFDRVMALMNEAMRLDPHAAATAEMKGDICREVHRRTGAIAPQKIALEAYEHALELFSTNILCRAKWAIVLAETGDAQRAAVAAAAALDASTATPHADQKLPEDIVAQLESLAAQPDETPPN
jgi:O-antigen ligase